MYNRVFVLAYAVISSKVGLFEGQFGCFAINSFSWIKIEPADDARVDTHVKVILNICDFESFRYLTVDELDNIISNIAYEDYAIYR